MLPSSRNAILCAVLCAIAAASGCGHDRFRLWPFHRPSSPPPEMMSSNQHPADARAVAHDQDPAENSLASVSQRMDRLTTAIEMSLVQSARQRQEPAVAAYQPSTLADANFGRQVRQLMNAPANSATAFPTVQQPIQQTVHQPVQPTLQPTDLNPLYSYLAQIDAKVSRVEQRQMHSASPGVTQAGGGVSPIANTPVNRNQETSFIHQRNRQTIAERDPSWNSHVPPPSSELPNSLPKPYTAAYPYGIRPTANEQMLAESLLGRLESELLRLKSERGRMNEPQLLTPPANTSPPGATEESLRNELNRLLSRLAADGLKKRTVVVERVPVSAADPRSENRSASRAPESPATNPSGLGTSVRRGSPVVQLPSPAAPVVTPATNADLPTDSFALGKLLFNSGDYAGAEAAFRRVDQSGLSQENRNLVRYMIGVCLKRQGMTRQATSLFQQLAALPDKTIAEHAQWQLQSIQWRDRLDEQIDQLNALQP